MTVQDLARILNTSWGLIKDIDKQNLQRKYSKIDLTNVEYIAIDEFSVKKGHKYMTVVLNLITKQVIYVAEGRQADSLSPLFVKFKKLGITPKAIAMDMWPAYISAVFDYFPGISIVFDRFHIVRNLNETLSKIRRAVYRDEQDLNKRKLVKGTRWLLLKNSQNLNEEKDERKRLELALNINKPLAATYYLKEDLKLLWKQTTMQQAKQFLGSWVAKAYATGIPLLAKFANSLLAHRSGIFSWFDHQISTGPLEGINNKIKVLKRKAYGYRDMHYFKLKIYNLHNSMYPFL